MPDNALEMSKVTFGLTEKNIEVIEGLLQKFGNTYHSWKMIGEKIGWCPLTACIYYQNYKEVTKECEHPYLHIYSKCGYEKCNKCGKVLCEG